MIIVTVLLGFCVGVTVAYAAKCVYMYMIALNEIEVRTAPKRAQREYKIGMGVVFGSIVIAFLVVCWVIGNTLLGGW